MKMGMQQALLRERVEPCVQREIEEIGTAAPEETAA